MPEPGPRTLTTKLGRCRREPGIATVAVVGQEVVAEAVVRTEGKSRRTGALGGTVTLALAPRLAREAGARHLRALGFAALGVVRLPSEQCHQPGDPTGEQALRHAATRELLGKLIESLALHDRLSSFPSSAVARIIAVVVAVS